MVLFRYGCLLLGLACLAVFLPGCNGGAGAVNGKVTLGDKPVASGSVMLIASDARPYYGTIQRDGSYTIENVPAGEAKLAVSSPNPSVRPPPSKRPDLKKTERKSDIDPKTWFPVPERYSEVRTSELQLTVQRGPNSFDIVLK